MKYTREQTLEVVEAIEELTDMVVPTSMSEATGLAILLALMKQQNTLEEIKELMQKQ